MISDCKNILQNNYHRFKRHILYVQSKLHFRVFVLVIYPTTSRFVNSILKQIQFIYLFKTFLSCQNTNNKNKPKKQTNKHETKILNNSMKWKMLLQEKQILLLVVNLAVFIYCTIKHVKKMQRNVFLILHNLCYVIYSIWYHEKNILRPRKVVVVLHKEITPLVCAMFFVYGTIIHVNMIYTCILSEFNHIPLYIQHISHHATE